MRARPSSWLTQAIRLAEQWKNQESRLKRAIPAISWFLPETGGQGRAQGHSFDLVGFSVCLSFYDYLLLQVGSAGVFVLVLSCSEMDWPEVPEKRPVVLRNGHVRDQGKTPSRDDSRHNCGDCL